MLMPLDELQNNPDDENQIVDLEYKAFLVNLVA